MGNKSHWKVLTEQGHIVNYSAKALAIFGGSGGRDLLDRFGPTFEWGDSHGLLVDNKLIAHVCEVSFEKLAFVGTQF